MKKPELFNESHSATYCPESNLIHLYIGRVPRDEYLALKEEGWRSTPKQSEAGGGEFAATWTPSRRDTAESYAGIIEDEDMSPQDRAALRAERFSGYLDKRTAEATGHADAYDSGPAVHGFQDFGKACRAADKHDRQGTRATDAWSKAEYWQRRTAGVIANALYKSDAGVRMGRINVLEADQRRQTPGSAWHTHTTLRLAYERQMLEAQGGTTETMEILPGGKLGGRLIMKVNKSPVTKRPKSCETVEPYTDPKNPAKKFLIKFFDLERKNPDSYTEPTPESLAELAAIKKEIKAATTKAEPCPLINPTDEDAERLQALWNEKARSSAEPSKVLRMTQAQYSERSQGSYSSCKTVVICETGCQHTTRYGSNLTRCDVYKVRKASSGGYGASRVIVITDKPQKPIPWDAVEKAMQSTPKAEDFRPQIETILEHCGNYHHRHSQLILDAEYLGWVNADCSQPQLTELGLKVLQDYRAENTTPEFATV
jgi:hypothetical protein